MQAFPSAITQRHSVVMRVMILLLPAVILLAFAFPTKAEENTYVITDGDEVVVHTTPATDLEEVLDQAGVTLGEDDTYTNVPGEDVSEIVIQRAQTITIYNCGEKMDVTSYGETVQELLDRMSIPSSGEHVVSVNLNDETYDGMEVRVDFVIHTTQTHTQEIPYETTYVYDDQELVDVEYVKEEGRPGQLQITTQVTYINAEETSREVTEEEVVQEPKNEIIVIGTKEKVEEPVAPPTPPAPSVDFTAAPTISDGVIITADGQVLTYSRVEQFKATAYTHTDEGCNMTTATGTTVRVGTVAVDPTVIPYGTRMFIVTNDGAYIYGIGTAEDCGGAIKGNRLDLYFPTDAECWAFGVRGCTVYFLD